MEHPVQAHEVRLEQLEKAVDNHAERISKLENVSSAREVQINKLYENVGEIKSLVATINSKLDTLFNSLSARITALEMADAKKWQKIVWVVIVSVVTAVLGYALRGLNP